jgi:hypothetical protein
MSRLAEDIVRDLDGQLDVIAAGWSESRVSASWVPIGAGAWRPVV